MNFLRATLAALFALAFAVPAQAAPDVVTRVAPSPPLFTTGIHANQVEPLVRGLAIESAHVLVFAGCYLALASNDTCVDVASKARARLQP